LRQSCQDFELIVVDDGSTDETARIATSYPRVQLVRQANSGPSAARNAGALLGQGEFFVFLDSDDQLLPDALQVGLEELVRHPECAFVYGECQFFDAEGATIPSPYRPRVAKDHYRHFLRQNPIQSIGAVMLRCSAASDFRSTTNGCEDWDLYLRISKQHPIHGHGREVLRYRRHATNLSADRRRMIFAAIEVFKFQLNLVRGDAKLEQLCLAKIESLNRELAGNRDLRRDLSIALRVGGHGIAKLFERSRNYGRGTPVDLKSASMLGKTNH
jgi:glycosyltransferase involved in cell wall biosynthesis